MSTKPDRCDLHVHLSALNKRRAFHIATFLAWDEFANLWVKLPCKWPILVVPTTLLRKDLSNGHWVSLLKSTHWESKRESPSWAQKGNWATQHGYWSCCWVSKDSLSSFSGSGCQVANVHLASLVNFYLCLQVTVNDAAKCRSDFISAWAWENFNASTYATHELWGFGSESFVCSFSTRAEKLRQDLCF